MAFVDYIYDIHGMCYSDWVSDSMEWNISSVYEDKETVSDIDFFTTYLEYTADVYGYDVTDFVTWSLKSFASAYDSDFSSYVKNEHGYNISSEGYISLYYEPVNDDTTDVLITFTDKFVNDIVVETYQSIFLKPSTEPTNIPTIVPTVFPSAVPTVKPTVAPVVSEDCSSCIPDAETSCIPSTGNSVSGTAVIVTASDDIDLLQLTGVHVFVIAILIGCILCDAVFRRF